MFNIWTHLILASLLQEYIYYSVVLSEARLAGMNVVVVGIVWIICSAIDVALGYALARLLFKRLSSTKLGKKASGMSERAKKFFAKRNSYFGLFVLGALNFVFLDGVIAGWLGLDFKKSLFWFVVGDFVWFMGIVGLFGFVGLFTSDARTLLAVLLVLIILIMVVLIRLKNKFTGGI